MYNYMVFADLDYWLFSNMHK